MIPDSNSPLLSVIIPTRGRAKLLAKVLEALAEQTFPAKQFEVIVVMDGPDPPTEQMIQKIHLPYQLRALRQPRRGTAAARGFGVRSARASILVFIDDDIVTTPGFLQAHYEAQRKEERAVVLGALKPPPDSPGSQFGGAVDWTGAYFERCSAAGYDPVPTDLVGNNFSVSKEALVEAGGWDEEFHGYGGGEDRDVALRLAGSGMHFTFIVEALGYHYQTKRWADLLKDVRQSGRAYPHFLGKHPDDLKGIRWAVSNPLRRFLFHLIGIRPGFAYLCLITLARIADRAAGKGGRGRALQAVVRLSVNAAFVCGIWEVPGGARQVLRRFAQTTAAVRTQPAPVDGASTAPLVAISILNWNGWEDTLECLESVRKLDYPNYLTVVVDNGSSNGSADRIKAWAEANLGPGGVIADYPRERALAGGNPETEQVLGRTPSANRMVLIRNDENEGFTGGNNLGIQYALVRARRAGYVFLLNNDASIDPYCLTRLVGAASVADAGIVGAILRDESGRHSIFGGRIGMVRQFFHPIVNWQLPPPAGDAEFWDSDCVHGGAMMIRGDVCHGIRARYGDYFRQSLFMYMEGAELHHCAASLGYRSVVARNAVVYHKNARSSGGTENPLAYYYAERNRILVAKVVLSPCFKALFLLANVPLGCSRLLKNVVKRRNRAARAILMGLFDGYRGTTGKWKYHDRRRPSHESA